MPAVPRHAPAVARATALRWDAAAANAVLLVAALVAVCVPASDVTLRVPHAAPSGLSANAQPGGAHWDRDRQDP